MRKDKEILIYIVDDDYIYSTFIWSYFSSRGYKNIVTFQNPQKCIDQLFKMPDLIILDYQMGTINGLQTLKIIKSLALNIPVIFLSGKGNIQVALDSLKFGALDYIEKDDETLDKLDLLLVKGNINNKYPYHANTYYRIRN